MDFFTRSSHMGDLENDTPVCVYAYVQGCILSSIYQNLGTVDIDLWQFLTWNHFVWVFSNMVLLCVPCLIIHSLWFPFQKMILRQQWDLAVNEIFRFDTQLSWVCKILSDCHWGRKKERKNQAGIFLLFLHLLWHEGAKTVVMVGNLRESTEKKSSKHRECGLFEQLFFL